MSAPQRDSVLFVCTANQCRSPMAEALLRRQVALSGIDVASAGFLPGGTPCPPGVLEVMSEVGIDLSSHVSRQLSKQVIAASTLVVTMTRQHLVDLVVEFPTEWQRCFTISDLVARAETAGPRQSDETLQSWVARLHGGRQRSDLLLLPTEKDIPDPIGKPVRTYRRVRDQLAALVTDITTAAAFR